MRRLIDDLLTLAKLEGVSELREEAVDVASLLERLTREANSLSQGAHDIRLAEACAVQLKGSSDELYTAFSNLVSNAVRYTPAGGSITLKWVLNERGAELVVSDTGMGIEAQHIPRLTERFYRVDQARSRASGGTGLGLAIVKHILNRHQGRLRVESTLGKGSSFAAVFTGERVILPVTEVPAATPPAEQPVES
jgi:two-component system phosphate regulon sensor histidine kinase PhoR